MPQVDLRTVRVAIVALLVGAAPILAAPRPPQDTAKPQATPSQSQSESEGFVIECEDELEYLRLLEEQALNRLNDVASRPSPKSQLPTALDAAAVGRVLDVATEVDPALADRLRTLQRQDPARFEKTMLTTGRRLVGMAELKRRDPKLYNFKLKEIQVDRRVKRLAGQLQMAREAGDAAAVRRLEKQLRQDVQIQVALSISARVEYLSRLKEHIASLEKRIESEAMNFLDTVEVRMSELADGAAKVAVADRPASVDGR